MRGLDQVDRVTQFTQFDLKVPVDVPSGTDSEKVGVELHCLVYQGISS